MSAPLLQVRGLAKSFGGVRALQALDFDLAAGEMLALIGPNGAGKSTCFNLLNGQLRPDAGSIRLERTELVGLPPDAVWRLGVGRTFQVAQAFASLSVQQNLQLALLSQAGRLMHWWRRADRPDTPDTPYQAEALALLAQVGMATQARRPVAALAYGDLKRVELALALANRPRLLLMDEPTAGMAPAERQALMALTRRLAREQQVAVLFTEHSMDMVFAHAERVLVLAQGQLLAQGTPAAVRANPQVQAVYLGRASCGGEAAHA